MVGLSTSAGAKTRILAAPHLTVTSSSLLRLRHRFLPRRKPLRLGRLLELEATWWRPALWPGPPPKLSSAASGVLLSRVVTRTGGRCSSRVGLGAGASVPLVLPDALSPTTFWASASTASPPRTPLPSAAKEPGASAASPWGIDPTSVLGRLALHVRRGVSLSGGASL